MNESEFLKSIKEENRHSFVKSEGLRKNTVSHKVYRLKKEIEKNERDLQLLNNLSDLQDKIEKISTLCKDVPSCLIDFRLLSRCKTISDNDIIIMNNLERIKKTNDFLIKYLSFVSSFSNNDIILDNSGKAFPHSCNDFIYCYFLIDGIAFRTLKPVYGQKHEITLFMKNENNKGSIVYSSRFIDEMELIKLVPKLVYVVDSFSDIFLNAKNYK